MSESELAAKIPHRLMEQARRDVQSVSNSISGTSGSKAEHGVIASHQSECTHLAERALENQMLAEAPFVWGEYANCKAAELAAGGTPEIGLGLLVDALDWEHGILEHVALERVPILMTLLFQTIERALGSSTLFGSIQVLSAVAQEENIVLQVARTVWEPQWNATLQEFSDLLPMFCRIAELDETTKREHTRQLFQRLSDLKKNLVAQADQRNTRTRRKLLVDLAEAWTQILQQELLLAANAEYSGAALDTHAITQQTEQLIRQVEQRLRVMIATQYQKQFGPGWLRHIEAKHKPVYERWIRYREKERQTTLKFYTQYDPAMLDYSLFEDLGDLVMAQWHLFRNIFDFGFADRNKPAFQEKIRQIAQVRNILAHSRAAPENELLRARVLCTDILLALDRAGEG